MIVSYNYVEQSKIIVLTQHGFQSGHSAYVLSTQDKNSSAMNRPVC